MAPDKAGKKRVNKRKSRTAEVSSASSSSESESESSVSSVAPEPKKQKQTKSKSKKIAPKADDSDAEDAVPNETVSIPERKVAKDSNKAFEEFYLRQAAQEFANDLDKLRSAGDFNAKSVPMLISALKQGSACFGGEEKARIVAGVEG